MTERQQPNNLDIERALLSACFKGEFSKIHDNRVDMETFYSPVHAEIFKAMLEIKRSKTEPDLLTVSNRLQLNGVLENIGGEVFLAEICNTIATTANIGEWIKIHLEYYAKRQMIIRCNETVLNCYESKENSIDIFNKHRSHLSDIESMSCGMVQTTTNDKLSGFVGYLNDLQTGNGGHVVPFGISGFDELIQLQRKQMFILGGLSNTGKTRFVLCDAIGKIKKGIPSAIFSWENPSSIIISGMVSIMSGVPMSIMTQKGKLTAGHLGKIKESIEFLKNNSHLINIFGKGDYIHSVQGISAEVRRIQDNTAGALQMAYIDHVQNMKSKEKSRVEQIESCVHGVSDIGAEYNIATMLLTQLNRDKDRDKTGRRPILADAKGSGAIEEDADYVIFLHRDRETRKNEGNVELDCYSEKIRGTGMIDRKLNFNTFTGSITGFTPRFSDSDRPVTYGGKYE
jgi:replicative DNA helicase